MTRRGWGAGAAAVAACLVLAGCGGDPAPVVTPSPSPTETSSATPSPTPSPTATALAEEEILAALPPEALVESFPGAVAFAEAFVVESRAMFHTLDSRLFEAMSGPACSFCSSTLDYFFELDAAGEVLDGGAISVAQATPTGGLQDDGTWQVEFPIEVEPTVIRDSSGATTDEAGGQDLIVAVRLEYSGQHWTVVDVGSQVVAS